MQFLDEKCLRGMHGDVISCFLYFGVKLSIGAIYKGFHSASGEGCRRELGVYLVLRGWM